MVNRFSAWVGHDPHTLSPEEGLTGLTGLKHEKASVSAALEPETVQTRDADSRVCSGLKPASSNPSNPTDSGACLTETAPKTQENCASPLVQTHQTLQTLYGTDASERTIPAKVGEIGRSVCFRLLDRLQDAATDARDNGFHSLAWELAETGEWLGKHPYWPDALGETRDRVRQHTIDAGLVKRIYTKLRLEESVGEVRSLIALVKAGRSP
jgi:hypothetical protein